MVRTVLSRYADVAPPDWRFTVNPYARPSIAPGLKARRIEFNVSHADGLVVLNVRYEGEIGVENVRSPEVGLEIADRYFAPAELAALRALPREQQQRRGSGHDSADDRLQAARLPPNASALPVAVDGQ
jgi:4'-phosphopantetheinyl transferase